MIIQFKHINDLADGDQEFKNILVETYIESFKEFLFNFNQALEQRNSQQIEFLVHKVKATVKILEAYDLEDVLEKIEFSTGNLTEAEVEIYRSKVANYCKDIILQLEKELSMAGTN